MRNAAGPRLLWLLSVGLLALASCREAGGEGEYFAVSGKLVIFNYRVATATFLLTLKPLQPMRDDQTAVASFEDPGGGAPIVVRQKVWPKLGKVTLESPSLRCIVRDRPYGISVEIQDRTGNVVQSLETTIRSSEDQSVMPDRPLVVGPVYTPNPELAGRPDGKLDDPDHCPAPKG